MTKGFCVIRKRLASPLTEESRARRPADGAIHCRWSHVSALCPSSSVPGFLSRTHGLLQVTGWPYQQDTSIYSQCSKHKVCSNVSDSPQKRLYAVPLATSLIAVFICLWCFGPCQVRRLCMLRVASVAAQP